MGPILIPPRHRLNFVDETAQIGEGTVIWHFAVILADVVIGRDCSIGSHAEIGRGSVIGDGTRIGYGVFLPPNSTVGRRVFIGPGVICTDDRYPRVNNPTFAAQPPIIEDGASIGAGAVLLPGIRIGRGAMIGAGAVVARDVEGGTLVRGERAQQRSLRRREEYGASRAL